MSNILKNELETGCFVQLLEKLNRKKNVLILRNIIFGNFPISMQLTDDILIILGIIYERFSFLV